MYDDTVVVVVHTGTGQLLKVCASREDYEYWFENTEWKEEELEVWDAHVFER